ncbi:MAG: hypothetical protein P4L82_17305 [Ancalomicrobiaceae bacterium]|nr:hypothetical protein [Ancalomicrobiaceae bacterium]
MTWKPLAAEPSNLELLLVDAVRAHILPTSVIGTVHLDGDRILVVERPGAPPLRAALTIVEDRHVQHGQRLARRVVLDGRAVHASESLLFGAVAVVDRASGAFLAIDVEIRSRAALQSAQS